jgi:hypothetical protein
MAVNLSPVGGVAAQFFTNNGAILTGGKLYTYLAGTTTPATTYTANSGNAARTNPIVLDSAGRVPDNGEVWLTDSVLYKFVLKDSNDVLIGTYDNVYGIGNASLPISSNDVTYTPAGVGAVTTTVQAKLRQYVSPKDFGAVGDGVTDDTSAIQAAVNSLGNSAVLDGFGLTYVVTAIKLKSNMTLQNFNFFTKANSQPIDFASPVTIGEYNDTATYSNINIYDIHVNGNRVNNQTGDIGTAEDGGKHGFRFIGNVQNVNVENCFATYCGSYGFFCYEGIGTRSGALTDTPLLNNIRFVNCVSQYNKSQGSAFSSITNLWITGCNFTYNGLDYLTDPGGQNANGYYSNGLDLEGYGIGSWFGNVYISNCDFRFNATPSVIIQDATPQNTAGFIPRTNIRISNCLMDIGSETVRPNPDFAFILTVPYGNWGLGTAYTLVSLFSCTIGGEMLLTNVSNFFTNSYQYDLNNAKLGDAAYMTGTQLAQSVGTYVFNDLYGGNIAPLSLVLSNLTAVFTNSPGVGFSNENNISGDSVQTLNLGPNASNTSSYFLQCNIPNVANKLYIYGNGNVVNANNSYGALSDIKLKSNITLATSQWGDVKALANAMSKFTLIADDSNTVQLGWVAQDVQAISPNLVFENKDKDSEGNELGTKTLGVNTSVAQLKAFKALGEALERIEILEALVKEKSA